MSDDADHDILVAIQTMLSRAGEAERGMGSLLMYTASERCGVGIETGRPCGCTTVALIVWHTPNRGAWTFSVCSLHFDAAKRFFEKHGAHVSRARPVQ